MVRVVAITRLRSVRLNIAILFFLCMCVCVHSCALMSATARPPVIETDSVVINMTQQVAH